MPACMQEAKAWLQQPSRVDARLDKELRRLFKSMKDATTMQPQACHMPYVQSCLAILVALPPELVRCAPLPTLTCTCSQEAASKLGSNLRACLGRAVTPGKTRHPLWTLLFNDSLSRGGCQATKTRCGPPCAMLRLARTQCLPAEQVRVLHCLAQRKRLTCGVWGPWQAQHQGQAPEGCMHARAVHLAGLRR